MSAVIYAAIVLIWLIVLVPMWLRRHEATTDERSTDRFEGAMRVLARRQAPRSADRRYVVMPKRSAATSVHVSGSPEPVKRGHRWHLPFGAGSGASSKPKSPRPDTPRAPASPAVRRRRTLLGLLVVTFLFVVLSAVGVMPWPLLLLPGLLLAVYVVHLRSQARQAAAVSRQRRRGATAHRTAGRPQVRRPMPQRPVSQPPVGRPAPVVSYGTVEPDQVTVGAAVPSYDEGTPEPAVAESEYAEPAYAEFSEAERTWEPTPVPPPTYSLKPPAPAHVAFDDLDGEPVADDDADDLDRILDHEFDSHIERRRAVND